MSQAQNPISASHSAGLGWQIGLWFAQIALALMFGTAGVMKTFMTPDALAAAGMSGITDLPIWLLRFIGLAEMAGALGIILPALTRIAPSLTPLAALGFVTIQILAIGFHTLRGEIAMTAPINLLLLGLALFVLWGRASRAPISSRW
jgi:uncharacterized membrane protein YphA (DoxX/SURF4 family)